MTTRKLVNLMIKSSEYNPYSGKLTEKNNLLAAIELSNKFKEFADNGESDEAMNIRSEQWVEVKNKLKDKLNRLLFEVRHGNENNRNN